MQLYSAVATVFSILFISHKKLQKPPSKVVHNRPKPFFHSSAHSSELIFHIIKCREEASVLLSVLGVGVAFARHSLNSRDAMLHGKSCEILPKLCFLDGTTRQICMYFLIIKPKISYLHMHTYMQSLFITSC